MYAIVQVGGLQFRVSPGDTIETNQLNTPAGQQVTLDQVLLAHDGQTLHVGQPTVPGAKIVCEVARHLRGPKVLTFKFRRREKYRRTKGHRQPLTRLRVTEITFA